MIVKDVSMARTYKLFIGNCHGADFFMAEFHSLRHHFDLFEDNDRRELPRLNLLMHTYMEVALMVW